MKIAILTTDTTHHTYFGWQLNQVFPLQAIFLETERLSAPFDIAHKYLLQQEMYEHEELLRGFTGTIHDVAPTYSFASMNSPAVVARLTELKPDVVLVFGTGLLKAPIINVASRACLNLHGGHPEEYRGLDNHLWAIYHDDFQNLVTTLHHVDTELDTGDIVLQNQLRLTANMELYQLRSVNTKTCVALCLLALTSLTERNFLPARRQTRRGKYYSFMPSELKEICVKKFRHHTQALSIPAREAVATR